MGGKASDNMAEKRDTAMIEDKDRDSVSLDKEAQTTLHQIKPGMTAEDVDFLNNMPAREQARIYHKVDRRLVPMLALLYLIGMEPNSTYNTSCITQTNSDLA